MKLILSHPTGNANVRAAVIGLREAGLLSEFCTAIASFPGQLSYKIGGINLLSEIRRRSYDSSLQRITKTWPWLEIGRLVFTKAGFQSLTAHESGKFSVDAVYRNLDQHVARILHKKAGQRISAVYAYEDGAEASFRVAKQSGIACFYDLPIGYWKTARRLLRSEAERWPDWRITLSGFNDSQMKLERKDEELRLADKIFVASSFTAKTLLDFSGNLAPIRSDSLWFSFCRRNPAL